MVNISTLRTRPKKKMRLGLVLLQLFTVVILLSSMWFSFGQNVMNAEGPADVPQRLGDMKLDTFVEGNQALEQVNQLHGIDIKLTGAYIAEYAPPFNPYQDHDAKVTVWVGIAESSSAAAELLNRMVTGITDGNSGFSNPQQSTVADHEVFQVDGPGGEHFFYNSGEKVVWLTIKSANSAPIIEEAIKVF